MRIPANISFGAHAKKINYQALGKRAHPDAEARLVPDSWFA
jgi:hypothetical protein